MYFDTKSYLKSNRNYIAKQTRKGAGGNSVIGQGMQSSILHLKRCFFSQHLYSFL